MLRIQHNRRSCFCNDCGEESFNTLPHIELSSSFSQLDPQWIMLSPSGEDFKWMFEATVYH
jgi:hypothetical protein